MSDRDVKVVIVMRADCNMRKGKMIAQGAHAVLGIFQRILTGHLTVGVDSPNTGDLGEWAVSETWFKTGTKKICVRVDSETELMRVYATAKSAGLPVCLVTDSGLTEFAGVPTRTCLAIGPAYADEVDTITGGLRLL